jgi:hypothetical protein
MRYVGPSVAVIALAAAAPQLAAQISYVTQERTIATRAIAYNPDGTNVEESDSAEAADFGVFNELRDSEALSLDSSHALSIGSQASQLGVSSITATMSVNSSARNGNIGFPGQAEAETNFLCIFNLAEAAEVEFNAFGNLDLFGRNENGEPSDLHGWSRLRLINAITEEPIAAFNIMEDEGEDRINFRGMLQPGQYVILANLRTFVFSADLQGGLGTGDGSVVFQLNVVPAPSVGATALAMGGLLLRRRRS